MVYTTAVSKPLLPKRLVLKKTATIEVWTRLFAEVSQPRSLRLLPENNF